MLKSLETEISLVTKDLAYRARPVHKVVDQPSQHHLGNFCLKSTLEIIKGPAQELAREESTSSYEINYERFSKD